MSFGFELPNRVPMAAAPFLEIRCEALDDPRDELLRRVEAEELSRADADKIARERYGFDSTDWPDASLFHPMMAAEWSLPMVFAWVICRIRERCAIPKLSCGFSSRTGASLEPG
jgi:hypothetical protein